MLTRRVLVASRCANQVPLSADSVDALVALGLDAVVVEVPHDVQDGVVERLLLADLHVLVRVRLRGRLRVPRCWSPQLDHEGWFSR